jgi:CRISPR-associated protein Cmr5
MTLEQRRAALAFEHVQELKSQEKKERDRYGSMAHKLPVLIRTAGLCQAIHFVKSRNKPTLNKLLDHLALQLGRTDSKITEGESLCSRVREAKLTSYLWLTREALASAAWYARLAQSELDFVPGTEVQDEPDE